MSVRRRIAVILALVVLAGAVVVLIRRPQCRWGTFAYLVAVEKPTSQEDWRKDAAVLVEGRERVVTDDHAAIDVAISPDGERIVVAKGEGPTDDEYAGVDPIGLYVYDVDGSSERRLTETGVSPDWSPDGETISFVGAGTVRTVDVDGGAEREVFRLPPPRGVDPPYVADATWSPDSRRIAVVVARPQRNDSVLWTVSADGSDRRRAAVVKDDFLGALTWSPDGAFAWSGSFRGIFSAMLMDAGGGEPRQVEPNSQDPVWSADGSRLAYVIGHEGHYDPRIVVGDARGAGEKAVPLGEDVRGGGSLADWASCR